MSNLDTERSGHEKSDSRLGPVRTDLVLLGGAVAVAVGAGMICLPAGLIAGGVLAIAGAVLSSLGGGGER